MRFAELVNQILEQQLNISPYQEGEEGRWANMVRSMHIEKQLEQYGFNDADIRNFWSMVGKEGFKSPEKMQQVFDQMMKDKTKK